MTKYYAVVCSVFDEDGNRIESIEASGSTSLSEARRDKNELAAAIQSGEYDEYYFPEYGQSIAAEIEVHDDENYNLLEIIE